MSFIKLSTGKFVVIDTVQVDETNKQDIDELTKNGSLIEAVIATHPFHTVYFDPFYKLYPNAKYYGTPRHLRRIKSIPWAGSSDNIDVLSLYEQEGIFMRVSAGSDIVNPNENNHFASILVFHQPSRTIHDDDTIGYIKNSGCLLRCAGIRPDSLYFHPTGLKDGLDPTPDAPLAFKQFIEDIIHDWDFDNIATAHLDVKIGGAKLALINLFQKSIPELEKLAKSRSK
eukprot:gene17575-23143_t